MICVCGAPESDKLAERQAESRAIREKAYALLSTEASKCTDENFMSRAVGNLYWSYSAEFECAVDQWFGAYAIVKKYVECDHAENECPDEPECFVYKWIDTFKVSVECDYLEDGLAALVVWFHENRKDSEDG